MKATTQTSRNLTFLGLAVALVGVVLAALLVCKHNFSGVCPSSFGCNINGVDGCSELGKSAYARLPFIPISFATLGLAYYSFLALLFWNMSRTTDAKSLGGQRTLLLALTVSGLVLDAALAYINFTKLIVPCRLCMFTYGVTGGVFIVALLLQRDSSAGEGDFMDGMKSALVPAAGSIAAVGLVFLVLSLFSASGAEESSAGSGLLPEDQVSRRLVEFRALNPVQLSTKDLDSFEGPDDAYIVVHKFADFRCPHCLHAGEILQNALQRWPGRLRVYYRHFPLDGTCNPRVGRKQPGADSCNGAQAALCAPEQKIFAKFYHGVFNFQKTEAPISLPALKKLAEGLGGDWERMRSCMGSRETARKLERDIADAETINISSTPTLTLQDRLLPAGTPDATFFLQTLDALVFEKEGAPAYAEFRKRGKQAQ